MEDQHSCNDSWHLRKELNIGHLLTTLVIAASVFTWSTTISNRVTAQEVRLEAHEKQMMIAIQDNRTIRNDLVLEIRELRRDIQKLYEANTKVKN